MGWLTGLSALGTSLSDSFREVFKWWTSESGRHESQVRKRADQLKSLSDEAYARWRQNPTPENWGRYERAKDELDRASAAP